VKRVWLLSLVITVVLLVSSFAEGGKEAVAEKPITLKHWTNPSFSPSASLANAKLVFERIFREFQEANPNIKVEYEVLPGGTEAIQKVLAAASANQLPDLGANDSFWIPRLVQGGYLAPLDDLWPAEDRADFLQDVQDPVTFDGKIYGVWFFNSIRALVYNQKVVSDAGYAKLPELRDEYIAASKKMVGKDKWAVLYSGDKTEFTTLHMLPYFWGYGGDLFDAQGKPVFQEGKNREALKRVYEWYRDMVKTHGIMPVEMASLNEGNLTDYFYAGQIAQWATSSSKMMALKQSRPDLYDVVNVANYPMEKGYRAVPHLAAWAYSIFTKDPARQAASWKLIAALTSTRNLGEINAALGHVPVRKSIAQQNQFYLQDRVFKQFVDIMFGGPLRPRDPVPVYPAASLEIAAQMGPVVKGEITPDQAIDAAAKASMEEWERTKSR
jgi:multiple sugar transport system substrate-binding protein